MFVIGTLPYQTYDYGYDRYLAAAQAREARLQDQLQRQILLDNLLPQHAGYDDGWSCPSTTRGCPRYSRNYIYDAPCTDSYPAQYQDLAECRARERQEALDRTLREREARLKEWKQQQRARRGESATPQTVGTFDIDDCNTSTELSSFFVVQKPGSSSSQHQPSSATPPVSQPTRINIDVAETKGKTKEDASSMASTSEIESGSEVEIAADPRVIQTSLSAIGEIGASLAKLEDDFMFPDELDFEPSSPENTLELQLAYTSRNAPLRYYDHALQELLSNLDAVQSHGSKAVRDARKAIVTRVEKVLERLEERIEERKEVALWKMKKALSAAAVETESVVDMGTDLDAGTETKSDDTTGSETSAIRSETSTIDEDVGFDSEMKADDAQTPVGQLDAAAVNEHNIEGVEETETDVVTAEDSSEVVSLSGSLQATLAFDGDAVITGAEDEATVVDEETTLPSPIPLAATVLPTPGSPRSHDDILPSESQHDAVMASTSPLTGDDPLSASKPEEPTLPGLTFAATSESPLFDPAMSTDMLHSTAEESDIDEFLLAQSPMSPPALTIPVHPEVDEDAVLVEAPGHEHDQEEDVWIDVEA